MNWQSEKHERKNLSVKFGLHLKNLREQRNISAAELSRRTFIEKPNLSRIEKGNINPSLYTLHKLAKGIGITLEEMFKDFL